MLPALLLLLHYGGGDGGGGGSDGARVGRPPAAEERARRHEALLRARTPHQTVVALKIIRSRILHNNVNVSPLCSASDACYCYNDDICVIGSPSLECATRK